MTPVYVPRRLVSIVSTITLHGQVKVPQGRLQLSSVAFLVLPVKLLELVAYLSS